MPEEETFNPEQALQKILIFNHPGLLGIPSLLGPGSVANADPEWHQ